MYTRPTAPVIILVTHPSCVNLANSIKCVGDSCSYLSYRRSHYALLVEDRGAASIYNISVDRSPLVIIFWGVAVPCPLYWFLLHHDRCTLCAHEWFVSLSCSLGSSLKKKRWTTPFLMCDWSCHTNKELSLLLTRRYFHIQHINYCCSIKTTCTKHSWHVLCVLVCHCLCSQHKYLTTPEEFICNCPLLIFSNCLCSKALCRNVASWTGKSSFEMNVDFFSAKSILLAMPTLRKKHAIYACDIMCTSRTKFRLVAMAAFNFVCQMYCSDWEKGANCNCIALWLQPKWLYILQQDWHIFVRYKHIDLYMQFLVGAVTCLNLAKNECDTISTLYF